MRGPVIGADDFFLAPGKFCPGPHARADVESGECIFCPGIVRSSTTDEWTCVCCGVAYDKGEAPAIFGMNITNSRLVSADGEH